MTVLRPGDVLLYSGDGLFSTIIKIKTWSRVSHCEGFIGEGKAVASRDKEGVSVYPLRMNGLAAIVRPKATFNLASAMDWHATVNGQRYDWIGLLAFFVAKWQGRNNNAQFCSEYLTRWLRHGGVEPFTPDTDADAVAPGEFLKSGAFTRIWQKP